ncbi:MAG: adenylate/guanylate cyclase domain-containing protein [Candidatus Omnitrophica bacterium]|nr:adenylate/guanylate cyclase domain-containing protein [Candidatus Omnitrophota bacterium]
MRALKSWPAYALPALVLLAGALLKAAPPPALESLQLKVFDTFQRLRPRPYESAPVAIVDLDDESLRRLGQWPWPRTRVAQLVRRLAEGGASVIAFDIVFAEPDRTSPRSVWEIWRSSDAEPSLERQLAVLPDHDQVLAQALQGARVVTGFALVEGTAAGEPALKAGVAHAGPDPRLFVAGLSGAVANLPELERAAAGNGHFNMLAERDGILRRVPLFLKRGEALYPSLVAEALRVSQGASTYGVRSVPTGIVEVKIGRLVVPTDARGRVWLRDAGRQAQRFIPAWRVLDEGFDPSLVSGKICFVGSSAAGLKDLRATPLNPVAAGTEVHAQLAEQALLGEFLVRPDWAPGAEFLFLLLLGGALILLLPRVGPAWCAGAGALGVAGAGAASWWAFTQRGWLMDPVLPALAALGIYLVSSLLQYLRTEAERRQIREAFSHYLSPELVRRLAEHPELLKLGGEMKPMSLLFCDIRGFTTIAEQFDAQGLTRFMNRFLTPMTEVILRGQGTIDKYIGDCIMAFWNAPLDDPEHARHACEAALEMQRTLADWSCQREQEARAAGGRWVPVRVGIGINTGECCVGNLGSEQRFDYSVLGDAVNVASRLEGLCKVYGVDMVVSESTVERAGGLAALEMDLITVKGKTRPVRVYTLVGGPEVQSDPAFQELRRASGEMLAAYRAQRWDAALASIEELIRMDTPQTRLLYALYQERIRAYQAAPPGPGWDGVSIASTK